MDHKELKQKAYESRSKPNRHRGAGVSYLQKSISYNSPHNRTWRKRNKKDNNKKCRRGTRNQDQEFTAKDGLQPNKTYFISYTLSSR